MCFLHTALSKLTSEKSEIFRAYNWSNSTRSGILQLDLDLGIIFDIKIDRSARGHEFGWISLPDHDATYCGMNLLVVWTQGKTFIYQQI
jgi:hypothetical protein